MSSASSDSSLYAGSSSETTHEQRSQFPPYLASTIHEALSSEKLDRCLALQSQTSGLIHDRTDALNQLNITAQRELSIVKRDFLEGAKLAKSLKANLQDLQTRIRACQELTRQKAPVEWHNVRDGLMDTELVEQDD